MAEKEEIQTQPEQDRLTFENTGSKNTIMEANLGVIPDRNEDCASSDMLGEWNSEDVTIETTDRNIDNDVNTQESNSVCSTIIEVAMENIGTNQNDQEPLKSQGDKLPNSNVCKGNIEADEHLGGCDVAACAETVGINEIQQGPSNNNENEFEIDKEEKVEIVNKQDSSSNVIDSVMNVKNVDETKISFNENETVLEETSGNKEIQHCSENHLFETSDVSVSDEHPVTKESKTVQKSFQEDLQILSDNEDHLKHPQTGKEDLTKLNEPEITKKKGLETEEINQEVETIDLTPTKKLETAESIPQTDKETDLVKSNECTEEKDLETEQIIQEGCTIETETTGFTSNLNIQSEFPTSELVSNLSNQPVTAQNVEPVESTGSQQTPVRNVNYSIEAETTDFTCNQSTPTEIPTSESVSDLSNQPATMQNVEQVETTGSQETPVKNKELSSTKTIVDISITRERETSNESETQSVSAKQENITSEVKVTTSSPNPATTSKKGFAQLEQMSHEDLLKQCKRQLLFLQKTKMKTDDLSRNILELQTENKLLKETSTKSGVSAELLRSLQSENDRLLDEKESQAEVVRQLEKDISKLVSDLTACKEQMEEGKTRCSQLKELLASAESEKKRQDALNLDLQSQIIVLRSERDSDSKKTGEMRSEAKLWEGKYMSMELELKSKCQEISDLHASLDRLKQELEQGKVLSLEIGDYERSLSDLHSQLDQKNQSLEEMNLQLQKKQQEQEALNQQIDHLEQQCLSEESRSIHLKETLEITRQQLASRCEEQNQLSAALQELKRQKEEVLASKEELQYQLSVSSGRLVVLESELKQNRDQSEKLDLSLKCHISSLTEELTEARQQLEASRKEFHNYKVRVHSVLKQQKSSGTTPGQPVTNLSVLEEDQKEQMEWTLELCKGKITQMTDQVGALTLERDSLQKEQEWIISKHNLQTQQMQEKETILVQRLEELKQQFDLSRSLWETEKKQMHQQQENLAHEYEHRLCLLETEHEKHVSALVNQLEQTQRVMAGYSPPVDQQCNQPNSIFDLLPASQLSPSVDESFDICSQERQEGEGSECTDTLPVPAAFQTLVTSPAQGLMPLERLLQAESNTSLCSQDPEMVAINMNTLQKKVDHISELLNESEASNLRLSEQTRLLKEEIRRLERNTERQKHSENLEYLKNVVLKFNTLPAGSERERLVPVISTLLKLSPEEQSQMTNAATEGVANGPNAAGGWGNYLHRWSGLA